MMVRIFDKMKERRKKIILKKLINLLRKILMRIKVFFNNSCNICRFEINHYKKKSNDILEWIDISNNQDALFLTSKSKKELLRRLHVINNGEVIIWSKSFYNYLV